MCGTIKALKRSSRGRTADRLGNRRHPLFSHAKELVTAAVDAAEKGDSGGLASLMDAKMDILAADGFEDVIGMAYWRSATA